MDGIRIVGGAAGGAIAAAVWAGLQPLDKLAFRSRYDDVELLGRALVPDGDGAYSAGLALHLFNGAAFGAAYARLAPELPGPAWLKAPAVALAENTLLWPLGALSDRFHPARDNLGFKLGGNRRAFYQATWRHLLFGAILGELERRFNAPADDDEPVISTVYSSNGHGKLEHALRDMPSPPA